MKCKSNGNVNNFYVGVVYRYINDQDNGKCYVGCTINEKQRMSTWKNEKCVYGGEKIEEARRNFGLSAFRYEQLDVIYGDDKNEVIKKIEALESLYIKKFNSFINGYNSNTGGHGCKGCHFTEEHKRKISDSMVKIPVDLIPEDGSPIITVASMVQAAQYIGKSTGIVYYYLHGGSGKSIKGYKLRVA